jgi:hypothetical protein
VLWIQLLLASQQMYSIAALAPDSASTAASISAQRPVLPYKQKSIPASYCASGMSLEAGLCYNRCKPGWKGLACTCWKGAQTYSRGCGTKPKVSMHNSWHNSTLPIIILCSCRAVGVGVAYASSAMQFVTCHALSA